MSSATSLAARSLREDLQTTKNGNQGHRDRASFDTALWPGTCNRRCSERVESGLHDGVKAAEAEEHLHVQGPALLAWWVEGREELHIVGVVYCVSYE